MDALSFIPLAALDFGAFDGVLIFLVSVGTLAAPVIAWRSYTGTEPTLQDRRKLLLVSLRTLVLWGLLALISEPVLHRVRDVVNVPGVVLLLDDSASMGVSTASGESRLEVGARLREDLVRRLEDSGVDRRVWFEEGARRVVHSAEHGVDAARVPSAIREGTDLRGLLLSAAQQHLEDNLATIVLFSDGRSTDRATIGLGSLGLPVFGVAIGDSLGPSDLRLDRLRNPPLVGRGDRVEIAGEVVVDGGPPGASVVRLRRGDVEIDRQELSWPRGGGRIPFSFAVTADSLGVQSYRVSVDVVAQEAISRNNAARAAFLVSRDRLRVFHVQQTPSWDPHFLRRAAKTDARFEWTVVHRSADGLRIAGTDSVITWPLSPAERERVDVWVAGSLSDLELLMQGGSGVEESITTGAGLLLHVGTTDPGLVVSATASRLLPLRPTPGTRRALADLRPGATPRARSHPAMAIPPELGDAENLFGGLPPLRSAFTGLDVAVDADLLIEGRAGRATLPLLAVRDHGRGRVAVFNGGPLWSWSFWRLGSEDNEELFEAWTVQLLTFLAEGGDRARVQLQVPRPVLSQGEDAMLRAVVLDVRLRGDEATDAWLEWARADSSETGVLGRARMEIDPEVAGGRRVRVPSLPPGEYRLRVSVEDPREELVSSWEPLTIDTYSVEFQDPAVDREALREMVASTGGTLLTPGAFDAWVADLEREPARRSLTSRLELATSLWMLLPWLALLSLEWALRKRAGLL